MTKLESRFTPFDVAVPETRSGVLGITISRGEPSEDWGRLDFIAHNAMNVRRGEPLHTAIFGGEDVTDEVYAAAERDGGTYTRSAAPDDDLDDVAIAGTIKARLCRWGVVKDSSADADGTPAGRSAYAPGAIDPDDVDLSAVRVQRNHRGEDIGRWIRLEDDGVGLIGEAAIFDTPAGRAVLSDVLDGRMKAFSTSTDFFLDDSSVRRDSDGEYRLIHRVRTLREAGPQTVAADPGAAILAVAVEPGVDLDDRDGDLESMDLDELLEEIAAFTGRTTESILRDQRIEQYERKRQVDDAAACIERALAAHKKAWSRHRDAVRSRALGGRYAATFDEIAELAAEIDEAAEYLRTRLDGDLYRSLVPRKTDLGAALLAGAAERSRRRY